MKSKDNKNELQLKKETGQSEREKMKSEREKGGTTTLVVVE